MNDYAWILGGLGALLMLFSAVRDKISTGWFNSFVALFLRSVPESPVESLAVDPASATLTELEKRYGIIPKNGKDEELVRWRIRRLEKAIRPDNEEENDE